MAERKQPARDEKGRILPKVPREQVDSPQPIEAPAEPAPEALAALAAVSPPETHAAPIPDEFPGRCTSIETATGLRCLYAEHDPEFDHLYKQAPKVAPVLHDSAPAPAVAPRRINDRAWWCGKCDNSQPLKYAACLHCGTVRA